jgi:hypothetical protein
MNTKLRLKDSNQKALGTIGGINPDITPAEIAMFVDGMNGLRNNPVAYAYMVSEVLVLEPEIDG